MGYIYHSKQLILNTGPSHRGTEPGAYFYTSVWHCTEKWDKWLNDLPVTREIGLTLLIILLALTLPNPINGRQVKYQRHLESSAHQVYWVISTYQFTWIPYFILPTFSSTLSKFYRSSPHTGQYTVANYPVNLCIFGMQEAALKNSLHWHSEVFF